MRWQECDWYQLRRDLPGPKCAWPTWLPPIMKWLPLSLKIERWMPVNLDLSQVFWSVFQYLCSHTENVWSGQDSCKGESWLHCRIQKDSGSELVHQWFKVQISTSCKSDVHWRLIVGLITLVLFFMMNLGNGMEYILSKFTGNTKLDGAVYMFSREAELSFRAMLSGWRVDKKVSEQKV